MFHISSKSVPSADAFQGYQYSSCVFVQTLRIVGYVPVYKVEKSVSNVQFMINSVLHINVLAYLHDFVYTSIWLVIII